MVVQKRVTQMSVAETLASAYSGKTETETPNTTEPIEDQEDSQEEELDETTDAVEEESTEEESEQEEEELPANIKDILTKNRKAVREAEARALAAEKALAAKDSTEAPEPSEADSKFKELYLKSAAKQALVEAGITTGTDRFLKMIDMSSVEVDDSGTVSGLEDQIADLKEEFKDVFAPKPVRKSTGNVDGSRRAAPTVPKTSAELLAARFS